ncbi:MAG: hypothetical protein HOQ05_14220 [Corynebacteriales bacterium]|nr:hypothetical protein [Mycobacteriales bacterium]
MYGWIWRHLPGNTWVRVLCSVGLALATIALLWFVIFPWAEPFLPFDDVNLEGGTSEDQPQSPGVNNGDTPHPDDYEIPYDIGESPSPSE